MQAEEALEAGEVPIGAALCVAGADGRPHPCFRDRNRTTESANVRHHLPRRTPLPACRPTPGRYSDMPG
ncbi:hypothetical protein EON67_02125 [archaeon]|nr:MAG: hypothetical protein EON67_02125 [archaeon]